MVFLTINEQMEARIIYFILKISGIFNKDFLIEAYATKNFVKKQALRI